MTQAATQRSPVFTEGRNATGSTIGAFLAVKGGPSAISLPTANTDAVFGITNADITDLTFGDIQTDGTAIFTAGATAATLGTRLTVEANTGKLVDWAPGAGVNQTIVGLCVKAAAANKLGEVELNKGGMGQG